MVLMVVVDAPLAAAALIALPITYLITARLTGRSRVLDKLLTRHTARGEQFLTETFRGIGTVRTLGGEPVHEAQWRSWLRRCLHLRTRSIPLHSMLLTFPNDVVSNVVIGGMLAYGAVRIIDGSLTLGAMIAFMAYVPRAYGSLRGVLQTYVGTHTIRNSFERLDALFAALLEEDSFGGSGLPSARRGHRLSGRRLLVWGGPGAEGAHRDLPCGTLHRSRGAERRRQDDDLRADAPNPGTGQRHDHDRGHGYTVRHISVESLRSNFAVVSQPVFLWNRSVAYNICYPVAGARERGGRRAAHRSRPACTASCRGCGAAMTRCSARMGTRCPEANASAWPWRGCSFGPRPCC